MRKLLFIVIMLLFINPVNMVFAQGEESPFFVEPIYPENQVNGIAGYFRLQVQPNDNQTVKIKITNNLDEELNVTMQSANAFTNPTGEMLYSEAIDSANSILLDDAVKMAEHLQVDSEVTLMPKETKEIPIEITVPNHDSGTLLGAVRFIITEEQEDTGENQGSFIVNTETAYAIAIQLDLPNPTTPNFSIGEAGFDSLSPNVYIEMMNDSQMIQPNISGEYQVVDADGNQLFEGEINTFKMAPKTQIRYPLEWNYGTLEQGNYKVNIKMNVNNNEITAEEEFEIENDQIEDYVERTQPQAQVANEGIPIWVWIIAGAIILAGLMFWLGRRKK